MDIRNALERAGFDVVGPVPRIGEAQRLLADRTFDCVVLDSHIASELCDGIALQAVEQGVPFIVIFGEAGETLPGVFQGAQGLGKPVSPEALVRLVRHQLSERSRIPVNET